MELRTPTHWTAPQSVREAYDEANIARWGEYSTNWLNRLYNLGLRERLTILWLDHFVTNAEVYYHAQLMHRYMQLLRQHALGNIKQFVYDVGLSAAMLIYLNGIDNERGAPNENYARELLELFTCGIVDKNGNPNYTQQDVTEISRCLTGYTFDWLQLTTSFNSGRFDNGTKTVFGQTGAFGYDEVIDVIFDQRSSEIAYYICLKLYQELVYEAPDVAIVDQLATTLQANNWELVPVLKQLLKSQHFFDPNVIGAHRLTHRTVHRFSTRSGRPLGGGKSADDLLRVLWNGAGPISDSQRERLAPSSQLDLHTHHPGTLGHDWLVAVG